MEIIDRTQFLNSHFEKLHLPVPFEARIFSLQNNITKSPTCQNPKCKNLVGWNYGKHMFL